MSDIPVVKRLPVLLLDARLRGGAAGQVRGAPCAIPMATTPVSTSRPGLSSAASAMRRGSAPRPGRPAPQRVRGSGQAAVSSPSTSRSSRARPPSHPVAGRQKASPSRMLRVKWSRRMGVHNLSDALGRELQLRRHTPHVDGSELRHDLVGDNRRVQEIDALDAVGQPDRGAPQRLDPGGDGRRLL